MLQNSARLTRNNFDLLRLLLAGIVCLSHVYALTGHQPLATMGTLLSSDVAVKAFFVVSGFLIFMSFERSSSGASYLQKRLRRIYPAYAVVVLVCAFGLITVSTASFAEYFSGTWTRYVTANLTFLNFLQPTLPGVFETNGLAAVNGALWTLKIEVMFYLTVPVFVFLFRRFGHLPVLGTAYFLSVAYALAFSRAAEQTGSTFYLALGRQLPGQLAYFLAGAFFYYHLPLFERHVRYFVPGAVVVLVLNTYLSLPLLQPFALATVVLFFALFFYVGNFGKYGDFSYGVYILHFPVIQLFIHYGWLADRPWLLLLAASLITALAAIAMWHLVEKRFLLRNSHYVVAAAP